MYDTDKITDEILHHLHIDDLNQMQKESMDSFLDNKDLILLSPTGSGKTLAYLLPLVRLLQKQQQGMQVLILAPARELALQIYSVFKSMQTPWTAYCCYGGHPFVEEKKFISINHPDIIIGTPGRIADHIRRNSIEPKSFRILIIDEFDKSLELGFEEEMKEIISQLTNLTKRMLISATDMENIPEFIGLQKIHKLNFLPKADTEKEERLKLFRVSSPEKDKINTLYRLLCSLGKSSIVFCNHRESVDRIHQLLMEKGICNVTFHGKMEQPDRERSLFKFRSGSCHVLVSTDLASRGLDIPEIKNIIHYHLPVNEEAFIHRNGRTARWNSSGNSYLILNDSEIIPAYLPADLEEYFLTTNISPPQTTEWMTLYIGKGKQHKLSKSDIVGFLYKKGGLLNSEIGMVEVKERHSLVAIRKNKMKQLLILIAGEKIKGMKTLFKIC